MKKFTSIEDLKKNISNLSEEDNSLEVGGDIYNIEAGTFSTLVYVDTLRTEALTINLETEDVSFHTLD